MFKSMKVHLCKGLCEVYDFDHLELIDVVTTGCGEGDVYGINEVLDNHYGYDAIEVKRFEITWHEGSIDAIVHIGKVDEELVRVEPYFSRWVNKYDLLNFVGLKTKEPTEYVAELIGSSTPIDVDALMRAFGGDVFKTFNVTYHLVDDVYQLSVKTRSSLCK